MHRPFASIIASFMAAQPHGTSRTSRTAHIGLSLQPLRSSLAVLHSSPGAFEYLTACLPLTLLYLIGAYEILVSMPDCAILASTPGCAIGDRVSKSSETSKPRTGWPTCPSLGHGGWEGSPSAGCRSAAPSLAPEIGTMGAWESEIHVGGWELSIHGREESE